MFVGDTTTFVLIAIALLIMVLILVWAIPKIIVKRLSHLAKKGSQESTKKLVDILISSNNKTQRQMAFKVLCQLTNLEAETIDYIFLKWTQNRDTKLEKLITRYCELGILSQSYQRALFYFLTQQWDKYEALDFDYQFLQTAYELADESLRREIGETARKAGRAELVQVVTGGHKGKKLSSMSEAEWDTTLSILNSRQEWEKIWLLAQKAPATFSRRFLKQLQRVNWQPGENEKNEFHQLVMLSDQCREEELYRETLDILTNATYSEDCLAMSEDGTIMVSGSNDSTVKLFSLTYVPINAINLKQIDWLESPLTKENCPKEQSNWLNFILILVRRNRRFDIEVAEASTVINVDEFDIEIDEIEG